MARGSSLRASEANIFTGGQTLSENPLIPIEAVDRVLRDPKVERSIKALFTLAAKQVANDAQTALPHLSKEEQDKKQAARAESDANKVKLAEAAQKLPPEVLSAITLPREAMSKLYRGAGAEPVVEDPKNGWVNGNFVYSFTPQADFALFFARKKGLDEGKGILMGEKDLVSFKGLLDLSRLRGLVERVNVRRAMDMLPDQRDQDELRKKSMDGISTQEIKDFLKSRSLFVPPRPVVGKFKPIEVTRAGLKGYITPQAVENRMYQEKEVLVYGIRLPDSRIAK